MRGRALALWSQSGIWTARETPRGDIGKLSNEDIAMAIDYRGNETEMIAAIVEAGWIDRSEEFRLVIHDWPEHAADSVHMKLARAKSHFSCGRAPKLARMGGIERTEAQNYYLACAQPVLPVRTPCAPPSPPLPSPLVKSKPYTSPKSGSVSPATRFSETSLPESWKTYSS